MKGIIKSNISSSPSQGWSRNLFEGKMGNIRTFSGMFNGDGANLPFLVNVDHCVFVQIPRFGHFRFPKFDVKSICVSKVFDFHGSNLRSKKGIMDSFPILQQNHPQIFSLKLGNSSPHANSPIFLNNFLHWILNHSFDPHQFDYSAIRALTDGAKVLGKFHDSSSAAMDSPPYRESDPKTLISSINLSSVTR